MWVLSGRNDFTAPNKSIKSDHKLPLARFGEYYIYLILMSVNKEAIARVKTNKFLEYSGWRFFNNKKYPANIRFESNVMFARKSINAFGHDFEKTEHAVIDFLLLRKQGPYFPGCPEIRPLWDNNLRGSDYRISVENQRPYFCLNSGLYLLKGI